MKLFKYAPLEHVDVLFREAIRYTQPGDLNDPYEMRLDVTALSSNDFSLFDDLIDGYRSPEGVRRFYDTLTDDQRRALPISKEQFESLFLPLVENPALRCLITQQGVDVVGKIAPLIGSTWIEAANRSTGVLCLSEIADSLLMWSHYADQHRGIVIEFDADHATFNCRRGPKDEFYHLRQVVYSRERPSTLDQHDGTTVLFTKAPDWAYERE